MKYFFLALLLMATACTDKPQAPAGQAPPAVNQDLLLRAKAKELARKYIIVDGHVDLPYRLRSLPEDVSVRTRFGEFDYERAKEGGLDAPFMSIYIPASYETSGGAKKLADQLIDGVLSLSKKYPGKFAPATSPEQVIQNTAQGKISLPMGIENGTALDGKLGNLAYFHRRGIRYITLTHNRNNRICDSSYDSTRADQGLTDFGRRVISEMNRLGIIIDVSHVSDSTFYQVMRLSKAPVIASHSSCRHFTPGFKRNMSDDMIRLLAQKGGVIQINFGSTFLNPRSQQRFAEVKKLLSQYCAQQKIAASDPRAISYAKKLGQQKQVYANVSEVADHIDHVVKLAGIDFVGLGSDFDGVGDSLPEGLKDVSQYPNLIYELLKRGYSEQDIQKICSENLFRVWRAVEKISQ